MLFFKYRIIVFIWVWKFVFFIYLGYVDFDIFIKNIGEKYIYLYVYMFMLSVFENGELESFFIYFIKLT